jgi:glucose/mannose-6-phosphate isomerase
MNLDDSERMALLDPHDMIGRIDRLPDQLEAALALGSDQPMPDVGEVRQVLVCGMGGSAIGADLLAAYAAEACRVPLTVWRDYGLPASARGAETLVILASHSGNTEEVLSGWEAARQVQASTLAITTGGELARRSEQSGLPVWKFSDDGPPRAAVGFSFGLLLALFLRAGWLPDAEREVATAVEGMRRQQEHFRRGTPVVRNPAKRMGGQLMDRWPLILGGGLLAPVARRWRTQIAELAKGVAQFEFLPEADHNLVAGIHHPRALIQRSMAIFLRASADDPRQTARVDATRHLLMVEGFNTDVIESAGETRLAQQWTCLHYGDYAAYYLAMAYGEDPTPIEAIEDLKDILRQR